MWVSITGWLATATTWLQPISNLLGQWKEAIYLFIAYRRGKSAGKSQAKNESTEKSLEQVDKIKRARNDTSKRDFVRKKYWRDE